jgi:hypothetical protein
MLRRMRVISFGLVTVLALAALGLGACGGKAKPPDPGGGGGALVQAGGAETAATLAGVEERLLGENAITIQFQIESRGRFAAKVQGDLAMTDDNRVRWRASGTFDGKPISFDRTFDAGTAPHRTQAVVLGWTRMGLLHNIARFVMADGSDVDHAEGGMGEWIQTPVTASDAESFTLDLVVEGQPMGTARLEIDSLGLPRARTQTVDFAEGTMTVEERYSVAVPDALPSGWFTEK